VWQLFAPEDAMPGSRLALAARAATVLSLGVAGLVPAATANALQADYYVDCSATGTGTGAQTSPWTSLATVNAITFEDGDTIHFKAGTTGKTVSSITLPNTGPLANTGLHIFDLRIA
jgi:hypothetical protein